MLNLVPLGKVPVPGKARFAALFVRGQDAGTECLADGGGGVGNLQLFVDAADVSGERYGALVTPGVVKYLRL